MKDQVWFCPSSTRQSVMEKYDSFLRQITFAVLSVVFFGEYSIYSLPCSSSNVFGNTTLLQLEKTYPVVQ